MEGMDTLNTLISQFEAGSTPAAEPAAAPASQTDPAPATEPTATQQPSTPETAPAQQEPVSPEQVFTGSKQTAAFAQMRIQNRQFQETMGKFAQLLGVQDSAPDKLVDALNNKLIEFQAKEQNIPAEVLRELEEARQIKIQQQQEVQKQHALLGFQKVKDTYQLDDAGLTQFAQQLAEAGKNPFTDPMDLLQEYRMLNFDRLLADARKQAQSEEAARQKKVDQHATTPSAVTGAAQPAELNINSIADLDRFLKAGGR